LVVITIRVSWDTPVPHGSIAQRGTSGGIPVPTPFVGFSDGQVGRPPLVGPGRFVKFVWTEPANADFHSNW